MPAALIVSRTDRERNFVEQCSNKLKHFRRLAKRHDFRVILGPGSTIDLTIPAPSILWTLLIGPEPIR